MYASLLTQKEIEELPEPPIRTQEAKSPNTQAHWNALCAVRLASRDEEATDELLEIAMEWGAMKAEGRFKEGDGS